ncbi:hypothetical protein [Microbacterium sp. VKM Ac-2923]|uniref:hypothetical protein n=1 Tax=Microbacterium sp. VKM Ac-2923 TaxID=2929476 RepID=UPI001FB300A2|nr:hypothetical protein [Microbacterium sp. VKM Ac-2923]MCJ1707520.1 hypothetical protein [Microbacterium sp. VKM Ac-2923]
MQVTAAGLWREWERAGALRPNDYDADVVEHLRRVLVRQGHDGAVQIDQAMDDARWSSRDLLHALAPLVASFTGMLRDLLRLMQRVDALAGTGGNLRVQYEFVEGDLVDESLNDFRERVRRMESTVIRLRPLSFDASRAFHPGPLQDYMSWDSVNGLLLSAGATSWDSWRFAEGVPDPVPTGRPHIDDRAGRIISLVRRVLERLEEMGVDMDAVRAWERKHHDDLRRDPVLEQIYFAATDLWPLFVAGAVYAWTADAATKATGPLDENLAAIDEWLDEFDADERDEVTVERDVEDLLDVLSLPAWGKRHELYSAWITTQLDRALESRLEFVVVDNALRFPFHATLLANLPTLHGPVELWCEVRSAATGTLHGGRKRGIQPDYRFQRRMTGTPADLTTVVAVEVKQYKSPAALRHGGTMRDYVTNLPGATVLLVAHGPLGERVVDAVPPSDRDRARAHPDVRIGRPRDAAEFRAEIARLLPAPAPRPTRIELRWSSAVSDLDLYVHDGDEETSYRTRQTTHSVLREDAVDGGPEVIDIAPEVSRQLEVHVNVYSAGTIRDATPMVTFFRGEDTLLILAPPEELALIDERWWDVARIDDAGRIVPSEQSREVRADVGFE